MTDQSSIERIVAELRSLAARKPLRGSDLKRAKELMAELRGMGFTNLEVAELTGWSEPTIKLYTRGTIVKDPSPKNRVTSLLRDLIERGLTLEEVETVVSISKALEANGLAIKDVLELIEESRRAKLSLKESLQLLRDLKRYSLSIESLKEALAYKAELESEDLTIQDLKRLYEASKKLGGYSKVFKAVEEYGSIEAIKAEADNLSTEKAKLEETIKSLQEQIQTLEERKKKAENILKTYEELRRKGLDDESIRKLKEASKKHGGILAVLEAINTYTSLDSLKSEISKLKEKKSMIEADLKKLNADYAHLQTIIDLCDKLLYKYKFSIPAIENLYETAKKYGEPLEAIKAIEKYGDLKNLETEIERLSTKKAELESRIKGLEQHIKELRGLINELQRSITKTLKPLAEETRNSIESIKTGFEEAIKAISTKYKEHLNMYEEYSKKFGELKAEAAKLEEDLKLARIVNAIIKYPAEAKDLPIDYDILMLNAIIQHCTIKNINPKVKAGELLAEKYYSIDPSTEVELLDLLKWANRGLTSALKPEV